MSDSINTKPTSGWVKELSRTRAGRTASDIGPGPVDKLWFVSGLRLVFQVVFPRKKKSRILSMQQFKKKNKALKPVTQLSSFVSTHTTIHVLSTTATHTHTAQIYIYIYFSGTVAHHV